MTGKAFCHLSRKYLHGRRALPAKAIKTYISKISVLVLFLAFLTSALSFAGDKTKVLLVLAHPDDETMMGPLLIGFKENNYDVAAIYATKGEGGKKVVAFGNGKVIKSERLPPEEMAKIRLTELSLATQKFGFSDQVVLGAPDNPMRDSLGKPSTDVAAFFKAGIWDVEALKTAISNYAKKFAPDVVITMGLDENNHVHHKAIRMITEDLFKSGQLGDGAHSFYAFAETDEREGGNKEPRKGELKFLANENSKSGKSYAIESNRIALVYRSQEVSYEPETTSHASIYLIGGRAFRFGGVRLKAL